jgi:broad specificity phosphatase PhoE
MAGRFLLCAPWLRRAGALFCSDDVMTTPITARKPHLLPKVHDPKLLIFIRHGQTDWNAEGRMQGQRDIPLNSVGIGQATDNGKRLGEYLKKNGIGPETLDFVSSPLTRTRATMELLRQAIGLKSDEYRLEKEIREITFGSWEGSTLEELADEEQELILQRRADKWAFVPPEGESYEMLAERIGVWLKTIDRPSVVVSHGGVFRVLRGMLEGLDRYAVPKLDVPQDKVFVWGSGQFEFV